MSRSVIDRCERRTASKRFYVMVHDDTYEQIRAFAMTNAITSGEALERMCGLPAESAEIEPQKFEIALSPAIRSLFADASVRSHAAGEWLSIDELADIAICRMLDHLEIHGMEAAAASCTVCAREGALIAGICALCRTEHPRSGRITFAERR